MYAGSCIARLGPPSSDVVAAPEAAAASGRNILSQSAPRIDAAARTPVSSSAAATGVPNIAPTVPAIVVSPASGAPRNGAARAARATTTAVLMARIGLSGPRLTPPARAAIVTTGSARGGRIGASSS